MSVIDKGQAKIIHLAFQKGQAFAMSSSGNAKSLREVETGRKLTEPLTSIELLPMPICKVLS